MNKNPKVAFIIVGWNNKELLKECFDSITSQTYRNYKIIFVDNASSDNSVEFTKKHFPEVDIIQENENLGFAVANNHAIEKALTDKSVEFLALVNTDATLDKRWLEKLIKFASLKPNLSSMQGETLDYYRRDVVDSTHIYVSRNGQGTQGSWRRYHKGAVGPIKVFGVNAAAAVYSRKFIDSQPQNKLFDESFFMYLEDVDAALRSTLGGWDNYLVPEARAYHMGSASSKKRSTDFSLYYTFRNNSALLLKNLPFLLILQMLPKIIRGDIDTMKHLRKTNRSDQVWVVLKARLVGLARTPIYFLKRRQVSRKIPTKYLWYLMGRGY